MTAEGESLVNGINKYREEVLAVLGEDPRYDAIIADVKRKFNADPVTRRDGVTEPWINYNYEGFPLIASKTKMTQLQNDVKEQVLGEPVVQNILFNDSVASF